MSTEYTKTTWQTGDIITADKMNNIENGIKGIEGDITTLSGMGSEIDELGEELTDIKDGFNESIDVDESIGTNKLITSSVTVTGNVGATRNVSGDVYLENGKTYRVQLWNSSTPDFNNITSTKLTIRDTTDTTDLLTIVSYSALNKNGTTFEWASTTGLYKFHGIVASANTIATDVLKNGFFVYYNSLYPAEFESGAITVSYAAKNSKKIENKTYADIVDGMKDQTSNRFYAAIGDSITAGSGASAYSKNYYWVLSSMLINSGTVKSRINIGVAGGGSQAVAANAGAYGVYITSAVTIPATTDGVNLSLNREIKNSAGLLIEANRNNPCYLSGVKGNVVYTSGNYVFTRAEAGTQKYVAAGSSLLLYGGKIAEEADLMTIFVGTNDALDTNPSAEKNAASITNIDTMTRLSKTGKYIVVSPYVASVNDDYRHALSAKYGQRYYDMYSYFSGQGVYDAIAEGLIDSGSQSDWATLLLSDGVHPNDTGHKLIAERLYERMQELGWVS